MAKGKKNKKATEPAAIEVDPATLEQLVDEIEKPGSLDKAFAKGIKLAANKPNEKKKGKKVKVEEQPVVEEPEHVDEDEEGQDGEVADEQPVDKKIAEWPKDDDLELFKRIESVLPKDDFMRFESREKHMDWEKVKFKDYTSEDCKQRWQYIQSRLRRYRIMKDMLQDAREWIHHPWTNFNKGTKKLGLKHPDFPKKPLSSYMLFYCDMKDKVLKEQPDLDMPKVSQIIAGMYNGLPEKKKQKYLERASELKAEYEKKVENFLQEHPDYLPFTAEFKKNKANQKDKAPVKPRTPLAIYLQEKQDAAKENGVILSKSEIADQYKDDWKKLSDKEKLVYIEKALEEEKQYEKAVEEYAATHADFDAPKKVKVLTKEDIALRSRMAGKPEKPPNSGYSLFSKTMLASEDLRHLESKDRMSEISKLWKELPESEKKLFHDQAQEAMTNYKLEYASYLESLPPALKEAELSAHLKKNKRAASPVDKAAKPKAAAAPKKAAEPAPPVAKKAKVSAKPPPPPPVEKESEDEEEEEEEEANSSDEESEEEQKSTSEASPILFYMNANEAKLRKQSPKASKAELMRLAAREYNQLSEKKKEKFRKMAEGETKKKEQAQPAAVKAKAPASKKKAEEKPAANAAKISPVKAATPKAAAAKSAKNGVTRETSPKKTTSGKQLFKGEPEPPPSSAAELFAQTMSKDHGKSMKTEETTRYWQKLSETEKAVYRKKLTDLKAKYMTSYEKFIRGLSSEDLTAYTIMKESRVKLVDDQADALASSAGDDDDEEDESSDSD